MISPVVGELPAGIAELWLVLKAEWEIEQWMQFADPYPVPSTLAGNAAGDFY